MLASFPYSQLYHSYPSCNNQCLSLVFPLWVMKANKFYPWTMSENTILTLVLYLKLILVWIGMLSTCFTYGYGWNEGGDTTEKMDIFLPCLETSGDIALLFSKPNLSIYFNYFSARIIFLIIDYFHYSKLFCSYHFKRGYLREAVAKVYNFLIALQQYKFPLIHSKMVSTFFSSFISHIHVVVKWDFFLTYILSRPGILYPISVHLNYLFF